MSPKKLFILCVVLIACHLQLSPTKALSMNAAQGTQGLELQVQTDKAQFAVGETINLEVSLRNTGVMPITAPAYFMLPGDDPNKNNLEIQVSEVGGHRLSRIGHVMTGRAIPYPALHTIEPGETYRDSIRIAGTFVLKQGRKRVAQALWSLGENPEVTSVNEYPPMTRGRFKVSALYWVNERQLVTMEKALSSTVWKGESVSNTIEISIK